MCNLHGQTDTQLIVGQSICLHTQPIGIIRNSSILYGSDCLRGDLRMAATATIGGINKTNGRLGRESGQAAVSEFGDKQDRVFIF